MRTATALISLVALFSVACVQSPKADILTVSGEKALEYVRAQVAFGPRPPGSDALQKCRAYLQEQLRGFGYQVEEDTFEAQTPYGTKKMVNLIAHTGNGEKGVLALASHYDTKYMEGKRFVGANDSGSSTGLLLELARVLAGKHDGLDYWFVFLDGEEAFVEWSTFDSTYGSRHLARRWKQEGVASKIRALILLDMIGDRNLDLARDRNSTPWLNDLVREAAGRTGLQGIFSQYETVIEDDHIPFLDAGIPGVDLIDLDYGPGNSYWHTDADTLDKLSAESMEKIGKLVLEVLSMLQQKFSGR